MTVTADEDATTKMTTTSAATAAADRGRGGADDDASSASPSPPGADTVGVDEAGKESSTIDTAFVADKGDAVDAEGGGLDKKEILRLTSPSYTVPDGDDDDDDASAADPRSIDAKTSTNVGSYRVSGFSDVAVAPATAAEKMEEQVDDEDDLPEEDGEDEELVAPVTTAAVISALAATVTTSTMSTTATTAEDHPIADAVTRDELVEEVRPQLLRESVRATEIVAVTDDDDDVGSDGDIENNRRRDDVRSYDDNNTFTGSRSFSTVMTLGHSDKEQESNAHDVEKFTENGENQSNKTLNTAKSIWNDKKRIGVILVVALIVVIGATIGIVVGVTSGSNQGGTSSVSSSPGSTATSTGVGIDGDVEASSTDDSGFVYMINMKSQHWCGHNDHTARSCGGHLASVLNPNEKRIVDDLTKIAIEESSKWNVTWRYNEGDDRHIFFNQSLGMKGVWIGGRQSLYYHNDTKGSNILDVYHYKDDGTMLTTWEWGDYSGPWYDGDVADGASAGSYWAPGQPDNRVFLAPQDKNRTFGEDALFLGEDGLYYDMQTCQGFTAFQGPGILRLPVDYNDRTKYPDCRNSQFFLTDHQVPSPPRPPATTYAKSTHVYALDLQPLEHCNALDRAVRCGGELASITNEEELVVVYQLAFKAHFHSPRDAGFGTIGKIYSVWLGGMIGESSNDTDDGWYWTDGSQWYDDDGRLWWSAVDANFSGVDLARPYALRLSSIDTVHNDADYIQKFIPWRLDDETLSAISVDVGRNITSFESETGRECVGDFRSPVLNSTAAIYRLPSDYLDVSKYPNCLIGGFKHVFRAPERET